MKQRYRFFRRKNGMFFVEDNATGKQASLQTREKSIAQRLLHARNEAHVQPALNRAVAVDFISQ